MTRTPLPRTPNRLDEIDGSREFDEQVLAMIVALTSEVTVLRARLDAAERLLAKSGALPTGSVDEYDPDEEAEAQRNAQRKRILDKVFRPLTEAAAKRVNQQAKES